MTGAENSTEGSAGKRQLGPQEAVESLPSGYFLRVGYKDDGLTLLDLFDALSRRRKLIFFVTLAFLLLASGLAMVMGQRYAGEVVIAPTVAKGSQLVTGSEAEEDTGGIELTVDVSSDEALAIMESRAFISQFVTDGDLLPILFAKKWDKVREEWKDKNKIPTLLDAYEKFSEKILTTETDDDTGLTTVTIKWGNPVLAAAWANKIVADLNESERQRAIKQAQLTVDYLAGQIEKTTTVELQSSLYRLMEFQLAKIVAAQVLKEYVFRVVDPAVVPEKPAVPYLKLIVIVGGTMLGFLIGISTALFLNTLDALRDRRGIIGAA